MIKKLKSIYLPLAWTCSLIIPIVGRAQTNASAVGKEWVQRTMAAMGGEHWKNIHTLSFSGIGYFHAIEQSERPEGPYLPLPLTKSWIKDLKSKRGQTNASWQYFDNSSKLSYVVDGEYSAFKARNGKLFPNTQQDIVEDEMSIAPEFVLQQALAATDLRFVKDTLIHKVPNVIISFSLKKYPVRLFINRESDFLTAVEITKPYSNGLINIWGDIRKTSFYSFWNIIDKNVHYPLQSDVYLGDWHYSSYLINKWKVNDELSADSLQIHDSIRTKIKEGPEAMLGGMKSNLNRSKELAPGIWYLPGPCVATVVEQPDGLVVIDASMSSEYGELLKQKADSLYPGKKIKALITTSDAWLHIGGLRSFAAIPGITIYHAERNSMIVNKLLTARYTTNPDALEKAGKKTYQTKSVSDSLVVGKGTNRIVLYTFKTEGGERMMMAYFPGHELLYASDLYQAKMGNGQYWLPQYSWEVYQAILKRKIAVKNFYGMHTRVFPFSDLEKDFK